MGHFPTGITHPYMGLWLGVTCHKAVQHCGHWLMMYWDGWADTIRATCLLSLIIYFLNCKCSFTKTGCCRCILNNIYTHFMITYRRVHHHIYISLICALIWLNWSFLEPGSMRVNEGFIFYRSLVKICWKILIKK